MQGGDYSESDLNLHERRGGGGGAARKRPLRRLARFTLGPDMAFMLVRDGTDDQIQSQVYNYGERHLTSGLN